MQNIQSKDFRMYTQYIYKKALINYENKRYWLNSIYSIPFGHPWVKKIEDGEMSDEEAINRLKGEDRYELKACHEPLLSYSLDNILANKTFKAKFKNMLSNPNAFILFKEFSKTEPEEDLELF